MSEEAEKFTQQQADEIFKRIAKVCKEYAVEQGIDMNRMKHFLLLIKYDTQFETEFER